MKNPSGTKQELLKEISSLKQSIKELEHSESERPKVGKEEQWDHWRALRLVDEMGILAETGRVITSSLDITEVYESIATEIKKLILFDSLRVNLINAQQEMMNVVYVSGLDIPGRKEGDSYPMRGTVLNEVIRTRRGMIIQSENPKDLIDKFPSLIVSVQAGLRSIMTVPLISRDELIGTLVLRSKNPVAYTEHDLHLAERIGMQIAGAIANARLYDNLSKTEMSLRESEGRFRSLAGEMAVMAEIGRVIGSTLNIDEVYERFAAEARKLIPFDRITVSLCNIRENIITVAYVSGADLSSYKQGDSIPLAGTLIEEILRERTCQIIQSKKMDEIVSRIPAFSRNFQVGLRSLIGVPLIYKDKSIGVLYFWSKIPNAYTEQNLRLAERIGNQIVGAIANSRLFLQQKQVEELLRESEERYRTIIESIEDGYFEVDTAGNFTFYNDSVCQMLGYTRAELMGMNNRQYTDKKNSRILYQSFNIIFRTGEPSKGVDHEIIRKDGTKLYIDSSTSLIRNTSGHPIGFRGIMRNITERKRAEQEISILGEISRVIGSTLQIDEVYERFAVEAKKLIPCDSLIVNLKRPREDTLDVVYASGVDIPERIKGDSFPLKGSVTEVTMSTKSGLIVRSEDILNKAELFSTLGVNRRARLHSMMSAPLISRDEAIGALIFRAEKPDAYTEQDLSLAERIGVQIAGAIANGQMFSDLKKTEKSLRESEGRFRALVEQAAVGVAEIVMETGRFITVNRRLCEMVGRTEDELLATTFQAITHPEDLHLHEEKTALLLAGKIGNYSLEKRYLRKDGEIVWVNIEVSPLWKPGAKPGRNMIVVEDITERNRLETEIREMSLRDLLTDLYNRRGFITLAEQQIRTADRIQKSMLLTFIDCDGLKWINDTIGHEEGDRALIDTANVLRQTFRKSDVIARLGGDEFAVLSIDAADINLEDFPKRLQQNIDAYNARGVRSYTLAMSWGMAVYDPGSPLSLDELMSSADERMYAQKKAKPNRKI